MARTCSSNQVGAENRILEAADSQEQISSSSESENSSDRSSTSSYRPLPLSGDDEALPSPSPQSSIWTLIQDNITSLNQLALTVRLAGAQHRQERIERFKNLDRNKQLYQLFEACARQKVDHLFPKASITLRGRMAKATAMRRARFFYLEQHQKKTSTLNNPAPALQQNEAPDEEEDAPQEIEPEPEQEATVLPPQQDNLGRSIQPSVMLSNTVVTKLDPKRLHPAQNKPKDAESVLSVKVSTGTFPSIPKLDPGGTSFTCPYCFLVCPAKEASGENQWK